MWAQPLLPIARLTKLPGELLAADALGRVVRHYVDTEAFAQAADLLESVFNEARRRLPRRDAYALGQVAYRMGDNTMAQTSSDNSFSTTPLASKPVKPGKCCRDWIQNPNPLELEEPRMETNGNELGLEKSHSNQCGYRRSYAGHSVALPKRSLKPKKFRLARALKAIRVYLSILGSLSQHRVSANFQQLRKTISASPSTQPEATILQFLELGLEEGKPTQTIMETEKGCGRTAGGRDIAHKAAKVELSGDWKSAVAYYQQYQEKLISVRYCG